MAELGTFDWDGLADGLVDTLMPSIEDLFKLSYDEAGNLTGGALDFSLKNPHVKKEIEKIGKQIRGVSDTVKENAQRIVADGMDNGQGIGSIAKALREYGVTDSKSRSELIARTETAEAMSAGSISAYKEAGVEKKKWLAEDDAPDADCQIDGEVVGMDEAFSNGLDRPPAHPGCLIGDSMVIAPYQLRRRTFARYFDGEVVILRTADNDLLTCTPKHPILTITGWVAAGLLNEGDYVIHALDSHGVAALIDPDNQDMPTRIEEIACSALMPGSVATASMPASAKDFHGDGVGSEVYVVNTSSELGSSFDTAIPEIFKELDLAGAIEKAATLATLRTFDALFLGACPTCYSDMSVSDQSFTLGVAEVVPARLSSFSKAATYAERLEPLSDSSTTSAQLGGDLFGSHTFSDVQVAEKISAGELAFNAGMATRKAGLVELATKSSSTDADAGSQLVNSLAGLISPTEIIHVERRQFSGHVYNLQTVQGWYIANNIITHNCRCAVAPAFGDK